MDQLLRRLRQANAVVAWLAIACSLTLGCQDSRSPTTEPADGNPSATPAGDAAQRQPSSATISLTGDITVWDAIYLQGEPVGSQSLTRIQSIVDGETFLDAVAQSELRVERFGQQATQRLRLASRETIDGQVERIESEMVSGVGRQKLLGRRSGETLALEMIDSGQPATILRLPPQCGGFFAVEWSLRRQPMQAGEQRTLHAIAPVLNQVVLVELSAADLESVDVPGGARRLLRISQRMSLLNGQAPPFDSQMWVDEVGEIQKSEMAALRQTTYRVDKVTAEHLLERTGSFDIGRLATVHVVAPATNPHEAETALYRVTLQTADPSTRFLNTSGQLVKRISDKQAEITVLTVRPDSATFTDSQAVTRADLSDSNMLQAHDPRVVALAEQLSPADNAWTMACQIERLVHERVTQKDFSTAFASAAEVAAQLTGDCTEHAVLVAALCRNQGIPARVLIGLVYVPRDAGFGFHMWNEVYVEDRWIPLDATLAQGGTHAAHLVLGRSGLESTTGLADLLPIVDVLGQTKIEILSVQ
ncbi:MAG: transglutaminase domain-containing protein [Planctomycetales bacterium]|nr:transglutaminase domain-containing protein [Planctomycetales bacterium]